ncbi:hypothetical protein [Serinicoccus profundi]|uniref:hypothetical protein n=1 Tax=Serinicoccus profundi TaxID=1078471 RepID=UPI0011CB3272|nr:hypothetical protein [Serinicoccus profundi]
MKGRLACVSEGELLERVRLALAGAEGMSPETCLDALEAAHVMIRRLEGARMHAARELAARTGEELLGRQGVVDPHELSRTARERWRARAKSVTAAEISALTGLGRGAARQLVAVAVSPASTRVPVRDALRAGVATWTQVEHFWRLAGQLPHEDAGDVARSLFATTDTLTREGHADDGSGTPGVAVERLDPDGALNDGPWGAKQFVQALHREVTRARSADPEAEARARAARHRARTAYAIVDDDGTGQVVITGDAVGTTACADRLYLLAKKAHAAGDERTEAQLRSDIARALLLHGTLPLPGLAAASTRTSSVPDDPDRGNRSRPAGTRHTGRHRHAGADHLRDAQLRAAGLGPVAVRDLHPRRPPRCWPHRHRRGWGSRGGPDPPPAPRGPRGMRRMTTTRRPPITVAVQHAIRVTTRA